MELADDNLLTDDATPAGRSLRFGGPGPGLGLAGAPRLGLAGTPQLGLAGAPQLEALPAAFGRFSDEALMGCVVRGDDDAFAVLYQRHVRAAAALATQMCHRRAVAEEVVQEAFLSIWRSRRHFDPSRGSLKAWMLGIVRNRAIDVLRRKVAHEVADPDELGLEHTLEAGERTDSEAGRRERARELLAALDRLPPEQSRVITLAYYGGYTHTEIATMLDTPIGTVKGRMRLGLRKMADSVSRPS
jgi:RNA polymerase sigma-70 factor, ECF subfamily